MQPPWLLLGFLLLAGCGGPFASDEAGERSSDDFAKLPEQVPRTTPIAITHAWVRPMDAPHLLEDHTVLVRDGRIEGLGPSGQVEVPPDAVVLNADGRYLLPGLADMHVHLARQENLLLYLANGITTVRNMWGTPVEILDWRKAILTGTLLGPRIYSASRGLDGSPPVWETTLVVDDVASAIAGVDREVALGFDFIKVYNRLRPDVYTAIVERAAVHGVPVVGHVPLHVGLERALALGQHTTEHLGRYPIDLRGEALREFAGHHARVPTWVTPTLVVRISFVNAADAATLEAREEMRYVHPGERANWAPVPGAASRALQREQSRERGRLVRALKDEGVGILVGTDSWISYVIHGFSIHDELRLLVEDAGLTPYEALRAATSEAARSVGAADEWGRVAPGLAADLLLLEADPLEDVEHLRRRAGVLVGGAWLSEAELQGRLDELAQRYASMD